MPVCLELGPVYYTALLQQNLTAILGAGGRDGVQGGGGGLSHGARTLSQELRLGFRWWLLSNALPPPGITSLMGNYTCGPLSRVLTQPWVGTVLAALLVQRTT